MAVMIVHDLEAIEVDESHGHFVARLGVLCHVDMQCAPIGDTAQAVGEAEIFELADVAKRHARDHQRGRRIGQRENDERAL